ncbi:hypothetical protein ElyMa_001745400 [Elysia marginata]|uniref:Uncharacterized protein n=1 Tax=Elysia marginata TaxID=1093978 RepID=A0AAV4E8D5_9GAST|nr:hypothetical protein ElyMa_001745400 [Elysia marginata]
MPSPTRPGPSPGSHVEDLDNDSVSVRDGSRRARIKAQRTTDKTDSAGFQVQASPETPNRDSPDSALMQMDQMAGVQTCEIKDQLHASTDTDDGDVFPASGSHHKLSISDEKVFGKGVSTNTFANDMKDGDLVNSRVSDTTLSNGAQRLATFVEQRARPLTFTDGRPQPTPVFQTPNDQNGSVLSDEELEEYSGFPRQPETVSSQRKSFDTPDSVNIDVNTIASWVSSSNPSILSSDASQLISPRQDVESSRLLGSQTNDARSSVSILSSDPRRTPDSPLQFFTPSAETGGTRQRFEFTKPAVPFSSYKDEDQETPQQQLQQQQQQRRTDKHPFRRQLSKRKNEVPVEEVQIDTERENAPAGFSLSSFTASFSDEDDDMDDGSSCSDDDDGDDDFYSLPSMSPRAPSSPKPSRKT